MTTPRNDLNKGSVALQLVRVSAPMSLGILSVLAIGLADAFFLARVGDAELAAVGFVYPVIVVLSGFSVGLSAGANTALSQARGADAPERAIGRLAFHACLLGISVGLTLALVFWLGAPGLFRALGAGGPVLDNILAYLPYWVASFPLLVVTMVLGASFRAAGDGATAAAVMVLTAVLNIGFTPVLVFGAGPVPEMGMAGAGLGTLGARVLALGLAATLALRRNMVCFGSKPFDGLFTSVREIFGTALPAALSRAINPAGMALVTAAVATLGDVAVAGFGAAARVQSVALVPFLALAAGLGPVVGQTWGAQHPDRARVAMRAAALFCLAYGVVLCLVLVSLAQPIAALMTAGGTAAGYTADYLRFVGWSLGGYGLVVAANAAMTGRSRAGWAMGLSFVRIGLVYIPGAWIGVLLFGYPGVLAAAVLANLVALWGALVATRATEIGPSDMAIIRRPALRLATHQNPT